MGEDRKEGKKRKKEVRGVSGTVQVYISCTVRNELDYTPCKDRKACSGQNHRPNLSPNSDDSLFHVIDSCEILGSTCGVRPNEIDFQVLDNLFRPM